MPFFSFFSGIRMNTSGNNIIHDDQTISVNTYLSTSMLAEVKLEVINFRPQIYIKKATTVNKRMERERERKDLRLLTRGASFLL